MKGHGPRAPQAKHTGNPLPQEIGPINKLYRGLKNEPSRDFEKLAQKFSLLVDQGVQINEEATILLLRKTLNALEN